MNYKLSLMDFFWFSYKLFSNQLCLSSIALHIYFIFNYIFSHCIYTIFTFHPTGLGGHRVVPKLANRDDLCSWSWVRPWGVLLVGHAQTELLILSLWRALILSVTTQR